MCSETRRQSIGVPSSFAATMAPLAAVPLLLLPACAEYLAFDAAARDESSTEALEAESFATSLLVFSCRSARPRSSSAGAREACSAGFWAGADGGKFAAGILRPSAKVSTRPALYAYSLPGAACATAGEAGCSFFSGDLASSSFAVSEVFGSTRESPAPIPPPEPVPTPATGPDPIFIGLLSGFVFRSPSFFVLSSGLAGLFWAMAASAEVVLLEATGAERGSATDVARCGSRCPCRGPTTRTATVTIATAAAAAAHCNVAQRRPARAGFTVAASAGRAAAASATTSRQSTQVAKCASTVSRSEAASAFSANAFNCSASGCGPGLTAASRALAVLGNCSMLLLILVPSLLGTILLHFLADFFPARARPSHRPPHRARRPRAPLLPVGATCRFSATR